MPDANINDPEYWLDTINRITDPNTLSVIRDAVSSKIAEQEQSPEMAPREGAIPSYIEQAGKEKEEPLY